MTYDGISYIFRFDLWTNNVLIGVLLCAERGLTKQLPFSELITLDCHTHEQFMISLEL